MAGADLTNGHDQADITLRPAWSRDDPQIAADAKQFWRRHNALGPQEIDRRVSELSAAAYRHEVLIGVATAFLSELESLRGRFAFFRCMVEPGPAKQEISSRLAGLSRTQLESWSLSHPNEKILGMAAIIPATEYKEKQSEPVWSDYDLNLSLVGYDRVGNQIRVAWFGHARLF